MCVCVCGKSLELCPALWEGIAGFRERTSDSNESRLPKAAAEATNINVFF